MKEKALLFKLVCGQFHLYRERFTMAMQVSHEIPYMERFDDDWATIEMAAQYGVHLRSDARKNGELPADHRFNYLAGNGAKRRKGARRGLRPASEFPRNQDDHQDSGPPEAGPSSLLNVNTDEDEEMMDTPGLFGFAQPSDDEESDVDDTEDDEE